MLLSVLILAVPKCFLGDSPDENPIPTQLPGRDALLVGTDWYPEQWPESRWETDLRMMEAAHLQVVRRAEFAWSRLEASEGQYDFAWLDRAIRLPEKHHLAVVLGTPTGGPPAWLTQNIGTRQPGGRFGDFRALPRILPEDRGGNGLR